MTTTETPTPEIWFLTGSQGLYGPETLDQVAAQSQGIVDRLVAIGDLPVRVVWKPVLLDAGSIHRQILDVNSAPECVGVIAWMHTFSPAKMWIAGLDALQKPLLHLHTQAGIELPWSTIDMDFMNLNQAAHGDREFGFIQTRLGVPRKTVAGHVESPVVGQRIAAWARAALGRHELRHLKLARFGDNMRDVAVTEGDKVEAQLRFGVSVNTYGVNDLVAVVDQVPDHDIDKLVGEYADTYRVAPALLPSGRPARVAALRRPDRARHPVVPDRRRLRRVHHELRGPRWAPAAAWPGRAAADGRRLRLRRRGRLEDVGAPARHEGDGRRPARRHVVHGGLHVPPGAGRGEDPRRPHARGVPDDHHAEALARDPPARHRRPRGPGAAALHRRPRPGRRRRALRPGGPVPAHRQRDRRGRARRRPAQPAGRLRRLEAAPLPLHLGGVLADGRRTAPHRALQGDRRRGARQTSPR